MMNMEAPTAPGFSTNAGETARLGSYASSERNIARSCHTSDNPKLRLLRQGSTHKRFDSGDWCLERLGLRCKDEIPLDVSVDQLSPKLCPEPSDSPAPRPPSALQHSRSDVEKSIVTSHGQNA